MTHNSHKLKTEDSLAFMLGGRARFTLKSLQTNADFSFEIKNQKVKENGKTVQNPNLKFVSLFIGANQAVRGHAYAYFGYIVRKSWGWEYRFSPKSKVSDTTPGVQAFTFVFNNLLRGRKMPTLEIWHEGICACCGKTLKLSESIELGWGPVCMKNRKQMLEQLQSDVAERRAEAMKLLKPTNQFPKSTQKMALPQGNLFSNIPDLVKTKR